MAKRGTRLRRGIALIVAATAIIAARERPTRNGDAIGVATRTPDGRLILQLRSVECDGTLSEGRFEVAPTDADYARTLHWLGPIRAGETRTVHARDLAPCRR